MCKRRHASSSPLSPSLSVIGTFSFGFMVPLSESIDPPSPPPHESPDGHRFRRLQINASSCILSASLLLLAASPLNLNLLCCRFHRSFPTRIVIDGRFTLTGQSLISEEIIGTLALATTYLDGGVCKWENWLKKLANKTIIMCFSTLGPIQFIEEAQAAAIRANASALIFAASPTQQLAEQVDMIATVRVDILLGTSIRNYLDRSPIEPMVKIGPSKTVIGGITTPSIAYFSSRGPNSLSPDILKVSFTCNECGNSNKNLFTTCA